MAETASPVPRTGGRSTTVRAILICTLAVLGLFVAGCVATEPSGTPAMALPPHQPMLQLTPAPDVAGDPSEGRRLFVSTGCAGCHTLHGVPSASGVAGPNLTNVVLRPTLAGETIPMAPETLIGFLLDPDELKPGTTMPDVGLTSEEAQHIAAFLYSQPYNPAR